MKKSVDHGGICYLFHSLNSKLYEAKNDKTEVPNSCTNVNCKVSTLFVAKSVNKI